MTGGVLDQVYGGVEVETPVASEAVESTRTLVLKYAGRVVNAPYSSTCGGSTAAASEIWRSNDEPYLQRVSDRIPGTDRYYCDLSPRFRWTRTLDGQTVNAAVAQYLASYTSVPNRTPGAVREVTVGSHTRVGTRRHDHDHDRARKLCRARERYSLRAANSGWRDPQQHLFFRRNDDVRRRRVGASHDSWKRLRTRRGHVPVGRDRTRARRPGLPNDSSNLLSRHYGWSRELRAARRLERGWSGWLRRSLLIVGLVVGATVAGAQEPLFNQLNLDKLQLVSLGASYRADSSVAGRADGALRAVGGLRRDRAELAHRVRRELLGVSLSRRRRPAFRRFAQQESQPAAGTARIVPSRISLYDVDVQRRSAVHADVSGRDQAVPGTGFRRARLNADGSLINGTFVERSLDNIAPGLFATAGLSLKIVKHFGVEGGVRGDLLSGLRSTQVRAGATYYFGHVRGTRPSGDGK